MTIAAFSGTSTKAEQNGKIISVMTDVYDQEASRCFVALDVKDDGDVHANLDAQPQSIDHGEIRTDLVDCVAWVGRLSCPRALGHALRDG